MYKVAIISCGMIANCAHIPAYRHLPNDFEIVGVCDVNENAASETAKRHNIPNWYTDAEVMLRELRPDVVSVCVPNALHRKYAEMALLSGANVLLEKPAALTYEDAVAMFELAKKQGKLLMACQSLRFSPDRLAAKRRIEEGALGDIYYAEFSRIRRRGIPTWGSFHIKELSGGGAFVDIGVHMIDSLLWLMGNPKVTSVYGCTQRKMSDKTGSLKESGALKEVVYTSKSYDPTAMDVEDFASGAIELENNARINFKVSWASNLKNEASISLCGDKAGILLPDGVLLSGSDTEEKLDIRPNKFEGEEFFGHFYLVENLLGVLNGTEIPCITPEETINVSAVLDCFYKSAALGRSVNINEIIKGELK